MCIRDSIIGAILRGVINGILIILTCALFTSFTIEHYFLSLFFLIVVSCAFGAIGVIVGIVSKTWDSVGVWGTFVFMPLSMLGGVFWSIDMLPESWAYIALMNPLYWMINGLRYSMLGISEISITFSIIISLLFAIIFTILASLFRSITQPIVVMMAIPFGLIGVILSFYMHGLALSFLGMIGMIGLSGVKITKLLLIEKENEDFIELIDKGILKIHQAYIFSK